MHNYKYNKIGNLVAYKSEEIEEISWTMQGKVKEIRRIAGSDKPNLKFSYDGLGNRVSKTVIPKNSLNNEDSITTYYIRDAQGNILATYEKTKYKNGDEKFYLKEQHLYGSSRIGMKVSNLLLASNVNGNVEIKEYDGYFTKTVGNKRFELTNHLGNVLAVVSDKKLPDNEPDVISVTDYYPFGMQMPGRIYTNPSNSYRFGFGNHEKIDEVSGTGNTVDMGDRWLNVKLGRTFKLDRKAINYPNLSSYSYAANNPIIFVDPDGEEIDLSNLTAEQITKYNVAIEVLNNSKLFSYYYKKLAESSSIYTIKGSNEVKGKQVGGYFNSKTKEVGVGESFDGYVIAQELFHAYQHDGEFYVGSNPRPYSTIETEGDIMTVYVMLDTDVGFPNYGNWMNDIYNQALESIPSSIEIGSEEYQKMFQKAVDDRIEYYKSQNLDSPTYTSPNVGEKPKALENVIREAEKELKNKTDEDTEE